MHDPNGIAVKICGIRTEEALSAAIEAGADYAGLVFFPKSPRNLELEEAARLAESARGKIRTVALFVDPLDEVLSQTVERVNPDFIQLHGSETPSRVSEIATGFAKPVIKAIRVGGEEDVAAAFAYDDAALILFDAKADLARTGGVPGGTGATFDWRLLAPFRGRSNFMLSGGLNPDNVRAAITDTGARAVDVSSGVETAPGVKCVERIRRFVAAAKSALVPAE